jgi:hypothetical protein
MSTTTIDSVTPRQRLLVILGALVSALFVLYASWELVDVMAHRYQDTTTTFTVPAGRLDLRVDSGSLRVVAGSGPEVRLTRHLSFGLLRPIASERVRDGALVVRAHCPGPLSSWCSTRYELVVPPTFSVRGAANSGSITVIGLSGPLDLSADSGSVHADAIASSVVRISADSGSIRLTMVAVPQQVDASADSGSVHVVVPQGPTAYRVVTHVGSGSESVKVKTDPESPHSITVSADSGSVSVTPATGGG